MDDKKAKFLTQLRQTFRVEAAEHVEAIAAGLLEMEAAGVQRHAAIVERIFREAHSLKGAARSVSLADVEALCVELESLFASLKRGDLDLSPGMLAAIHPALGVLSALCSNPGADLSPEARESGRLAMNGLRRAASGPAAAVTATVPTEAPSRAETSLNRVEAESSAPETVRVSTRKLGAILQDAEELVGARIAATVLAAELRAVSAELATRTRQHPGTADSLRRLAGAAQQDARALAAIADRLLENAKNVLLLPCSHLFGALPRVLRDLASDEGKEADLVVTGEDIEIDRRVLDELKDPLIHLLRNSVGHGIETPDARELQGKRRRGLVTLAATPVEGNRVEITVADDGAGIDADKVRRAAANLGLVPAEQTTPWSEADATGWIFHSGLTTSSMLTNLSGRGLGLAIVREKVEKLGGTLTVASTMGVGTTFRLRVPSSLATFRGVFVEVAGRRFVIPTASVVRVSRVRPDEIGTVENRRTVAVGGRALPLVRLRDVLGLAGPDGRKDGAIRPVVVVRASDRQVAFLVDEVDGEQEVMVRGLGRNLARVRNVAGASISGSGAVIPILDPVDLLESALAAGMPESTRTPTDDGMAPRRSRLLIAEDSITARTLVKGILEGAGYDVVAAVDGMDALTRLKTDPFDLLVSDVDMPRLNGFELTARVRADATLADLPVVLVTALGSRKDREFGIEVGANAYIVKSDFDQGNLLEVIRRLL